MAAKAKYLVVGADGMLGTAWSRLLGEEGRSFAGLDYPTIDITDAASVDLGIPDDTTVVINCAAYTDVDGAEENEASAFAVNATGVGVLAGRCKEVGATLVHYSTDYVFDGSATEPYGVDAKHSPINAYGRTKAAGEELLEASAADYLLVRTSWVYAPWAKNFVRTMVMLGETKPSLKVVNDQRGRPTSAEHLASTSLRLLDQGARGTFHVCDGGDCTWYEFAAEIMRIQGAECVVSPCTTAEFPRPAPRPSYGVLDLAKTEALVGVMPAWQANLAAVLGRG